MVPPQRIFSSLTSCTIVMESSRQPLEGLIMFLKYMPSLRSLDVTFSDPRFSQAVPESTPELIAYLPCLKKFSLRDCHFSYHLLDAVEIPNIVPLTIYYGFGLLTDPLDVLALFPPRRHYLHLSLGTGNY